MKLNQSSIFAILIFLVFASASLAADKPNVLFIAIDDLRTELGCYGEKLIKSPNIDGLADSGVLFERAYCQVAVCNPSRVSIMTGLRPDTTKVWDLVTRFRTTVPNAVTLPKHFTNHGYHAVSFGKIFHNPWPDNQSWSEPHQWPKNSKLWSDEAKQRLGEFRKQMKLDGRPQAKINRMRAQATEMVDIPDHEHIDGAIAQQAITAMRRLSQQDEPFFLAAGFVRPHLPFVVPRKYWDLYDAEAIPLAENSVLPKRSPAFAMNTMYELRDYFDFEATPRPDQGSLNESQQRRLKHGYYASVSFIDSLVGELLNELESLGLDQNTAVVLWSDHGWKLGEHNSWCKQTNHEMDARVPLIIRAPSPKANGKKSRDLVELLDVFPTLCELAGLPIPDRLEGKSLVPQLSEPNRSFRNAAFSQFKRTHDGVPLMGYSIRTDRYRYTEWQDRRDRSIVATELYDHTLDPRENENVAETPEYQGTAGKLSTQMWKTLPPPAKFEPAKSKKNRPQVGFRSSADRRPNVVSRMADDGSGPHAVALDAPLVKTPNGVDSDTHRFEVSGYSTRTIEGWPVRISDRLMAEQKVKTLKAIELMGEQLRIITEVIPEKVLAKIRCVPIWMSPPYDSVRPTAEYHPDEGWLRKAGRHPELVQCVELTNIGIFEKEHRRMPMMILHELAHAYHHQVLGFDFPEIQASYDRAAASGTYEAIQRNNGKTERAYGMNNSKEYFAESTEAFFGRNDFFPFDRKQLKLHDPRMFELVQRVWEVDESDSQNDPSSLYPVTRPLASLKVASFYEKYVSASGYPIVASARVNDFALKEAAYLIDMLLAKRPDVRNAMIASGSRMIVMAHDEFTTDIPEHSQLRPKDFWDARARGLGGSRDEPVCSCGEENLLGLEGDPYSSENILIHEFAHNIHLRGMLNLDPTFDDRLKLSYEKAMAAGLWEGKYASTNHAEYFAEGVQSWFNNNRQPDHDHNHVDTREELKEYDPGLASLCEEVFGDTDLVYTKPVTRLTGHLAGYDPSQSPRFVWPARLTKAKAEIRESVKKRGTQRQREYKN